MTVKFKEIEAEEKPYTFEKNCVDLKVCFDRGQIYLDKDQSTVIRSTRDNKIWAWHNSDCGVMHNLKDREAFIDQYGIVHHNKCTKSRSFWSKLKGIFSHGEG